MNNQSISNATNLNNKLLRQIKGQKSHSLILLFALCSLLFVTACSDLYNSGSYEVEGPITGRARENSITISISRATSRTVGTSWMPPGTDLNDLDHTITVIDCNNDKQEVTGVRMGSTPVSFRVPIGPCSVTVKAYLDMVLMAEGSGSKTIVAGQNTIPIEMGAPTIRVVTNMIGNQGRDSLTAAPASGKPGDAINLNYTVDSGQASNQLVFNGVSAGIAPVSLGGSGTRPYTVDINDNINGEIKITGVFTHTNLTPNTIAFAVSTETKTYGDAPFTHALTDSGATSGSGSGTVTYSSSNASIATVNAATGQVTILKASAGTITITATKASDGIYAQAIATYTLGVAPKALTITGVTAANRVYDGTLTIALSGGTLAGVVGSDTVGFTLGNGVVAAAGVGSGKVVTTSINLTGTDAGNYTLTQPAYVTVNITQKSVTITGLSAQNKPYDGSTAAIVSGTAVISGMITGDNVTVNAGTAVFSDANVANGKTVTFSGYSLGGTDAGNYVLSAQPASVTANITLGTGATVNAPTLSSKTDNTIVIIAPTAPANGQSVEYAKNTTNTAPTSGWQSDLTFRGLSANTQYYIFARSAANANYSTGTASSSLSVTTNSAASLSLTPNPLTFPAIQYGYAPPGAENITINNSGGTAASVTGITLSGGGASSFTLGGTLTPTVPASSSATFTVQPKASLAVGTHTETVTVTYGGGTATTTVSITVKNLWTVSYNINGGTGTAPGNQTVAEGGSITLPGGTGFSNTGYLCIFDGWTTVVNGMTITVSSPYTPTGNVTLDAKWIPYALGDTGPGGGTIFYVADGLNGTTFGFTMTDDSSTAYYLEAAPSDIGPPISWAASDDSINTSIGLGDGRKNTANILAFYTSATTTNNAAKACTALGTGWFLPSIEELIILCEYNDRNSNNELGLSVMQYYWSSSQDNITAAIVYDRNGPGFYSDYKTLTTARARAIRAF